MRDSLDPMDSGLSDTQPFPVVYYIQYVHFGYVAIYLSSPSLKKYHQR